MPYLGDYLGYLFKEIANAKLQADLEAVRIAELYASHPLLKHMPVPFFRLPTLNLDVPVAIKEIEAEKNSVQPPTDKVLAEIKTTFGKVLDSQLAKAKISLTAKQRELLNNQLNEATADFGQPHQLSITKTADELVYTVNKFLQELPAKQRSFKRPEQGVLSEQLKPAVLAEFAKFLQEPQRRVRVAVTTGELREVGAPEMLATFRLSIKEDSAEWTILDPEDKAKHRLVPE